MFIKSSLFPAFLIPFISAPEGVELQEVTCPGGKFAIFRVRVTEETPEECPPEWREIFSDYHDQWLSAVYSLARKGEVWAEDYILWLLNEELHARDRAPNLTLSRYLVEVAVKVVRRRCKADDVRIVGGGWWFKPCSDRPAPAIAGPGVWDSPDIDWSQGGTTYYF